MSKIRCVPMMDEKKVGVIIDSGFVFSTLVLTPNEALALSDNLKKARTDCLIIPVNGKV